MPTYQYRCTECGTELEVVQKFSDEALTVCPECAGLLRKVFNAVGVVFKGSGFYATDSRKAKHKHHKHEKHSAGTSSDGAGTAGKAEPKSEGKHSGTSSSTEKTSAA